MSEWKRRLRPRSELQWGALVLGILIAFIAVGYVALGFALRDIQAGVTSIAILVGGVFAVLKLRLFRDLEPHLTVSQEVSHRPVGDSYVHIVVTSNLHNSSRVLVDLRKGLFRLQQVQPITDAEIESLDAQVFVSQQARDFQWPTLDEFTREWPKNAASIEPGESHQETCEFIVDSKVKCVLTYTYVWNSKWSPHSPAPEGWAATMVYDIVNGSEVSAVS